MKFFNTWKYQCIKAEKTGWNIYDKVNKKVLGSYKKIPDYVKESLNEIQ